MDTQQAIDELRSYGFFVSNDGTVVADPLDGPDGFYLEAPHAAVDAYEHLLISGHGGTPCDYDPLNHTGDHHYDY